LQQKKSRTGNEPSKNTPDDDDEVEEEESESMAELVQESAENPLGGWR
jgi:hypothetical protein